MKGLIACAAGAVVAGLVLLSPSMADAQQDSRTYELFIGIAVTDDADLAPGARRALGKAMDERVVVLKVADTQDGKMNAERAFRTKLTGVAGLQFCLASREQNRGGNTEILIPLTADEAIDPDLDLAMNPTDLNRFASVGLKAVVDAKTGACVIRKSSDGSEARFKGVKQFSAAIGYARSVTAIKGAIVGPLTRAIRNGETELAYFFLERKVNPDNGYFDGKLFEPKPKAPAAPGKGTREELDDTLHHRIAARGYPLDMPLWAAAEKRDEELLSKLIDSGARSFNSYVILKAVLRKELEIASLLAKHGAKLEWADGVLLLGRAVTADDDVLAKIALDAGIDPDSEYVGPSWKIDDSPKSVRISAKEKVSKLLEKYGNK